MGCGGWAVSLLVDRNRNIISTIQFAREMEREREREKRDSGKIVGKRRGTGRTEEKQSDRKPAEQ